MTDFHVAQVTLRRMDDLVGRGVIGSKEELLRIGLAVGLLEDAKERVDGPMVFHALDEVDSGRVFTVVAAARNPEADDEEKLAGALEQYAEAGMRQLMKETAAGGIDWYELVRRYRGPA